MKLVKNLTDNGIRFYWIDESEDRLSPELATLQLAKEWRIQTLFNTYKAVERRSSIIDRRSDSNKRERISKNHHSLQSNPQGRRVADRVVEVYIDLAKKQLQALC
ncbi:hypothetical protein [Neptunomonas antarctica]|uniref:Uncharacterized protein n=1 Tax=Neptunomonas antarctica TaxID=619304 RepID=A0A1N7NDG9_9GAMM|nr:hypothetical protein [Neptunomonas antarctica]SIS96394.1 hypothetical protein SAMN05421760_10931 [Neptunomonas antarctica]